MDIDGLHKRNIFEFVKCKVVIKYGKLQRVWFGADDLIHGFLPKNRTDFEFEKYSKARAEFYPDRYNYLLTYESENGTQEVFLKLNWFKVWQIRLASRRTMLQSKDIKMEVLKYSVLGIIAWGIGLLPFQKCSNTDADKRPSQKNDNTIITERKASIKIKDSVFLTDSLRVQ